MVDRRRSILAHPEIKDPDLNQAASLLNWMTLINLIAAVGCLIIAALQPAWANTALAIAGYLFLTALLGQIAVRRRNIRMGSVVYLLFTWAGITYVVVQTNWASSPLAVLYVIPVVLSGFLLHRLAPSFLALASLISMAGAALAQNSHLVRPWILMEGLIWLVYGGAFALVVIAVWLVIDNYNKRLTKARADVEEVEQNKRALEVQRDELAQRNAARTAEISRYLLYMQVTAETGQLVQMQSDPRRLSQQFVDLLQERFGLYYVGLFLVDQVGQWAVLHAGTGEAGSAMLASQHKVEIGYGAVGWSIANNRSKLVSDGEENAVRLGTPELPLTRAEAAIPMRSLGRVIGAITLQSVRSDEFTPEMITVFQYLADTLAMALDNTRLSALQLARASHPIPVSEQGEWADFFATIGSTGYLYDRISIAPVRGGKTSATLRALADGKTVCANESGTPVACVPVKVRGQVVGTLTFRKAQHSGSWKDREIALLEQLADQLGIAVDSARLYHNIQRQAYQEQLTAEITGRMRESLDVETVMRTAVDEIYRALALEEILIQVIEPESEGI